MKKSFLFFASAALLASCSSDLFESDSYQASNHKGITFEVVENAATRGLTEEVGGAFKSYFFAEQDRINIWSDNALDAGNSKTLWDNAPVLYKATSSTGNPRFTAIDDANILNFRPWNTAPAAGGPVGKFFVAYPTDQTVENVAGKFKVTPNINLQEQTMDGYMNFNSRLMYDYAEAQKENGSVKETNISVGEKVEMQLKSPLSLAAFYIKDINDYRSQFGKLNQVMFTALGDEPLIPAKSGQDIIVEQEDLIKIDGKWYLKVDCTPHYPTLAVTGAAVEIPVGSGNYYLASTCEKVGGVYVLGEHSEKCTNPNAEDTSAEPTSWTAGGSEHYVGQVISHVTYNDYFSFNPADETVSYVNKSEGAPMVKRAKLNITNVDIKNNDMMNLYVLPTSGHDESNMAKYTITYKFDYVDLSYVKETKANFKADGGLKFGLEIAEQFPYIVTKGAGGDNRTLIVNSGNLKQVFDGNMVKWTDEHATTGKVDPTKIKSIVINKNVAPITSTEEWNLLNKFTNATDLDILNGTPRLVDVKGLDALETLNAPHVQEVAKNAFDAGIAGSLENLILPEATKIGTQTVNFSQLKGLNLASYTFTDNEAVTPDVFFNTNTKNTLVTVNLSAVTSLAPVFGYERNILFTDYTALKNIYLNEAGTKISANEFKGCTNLSIVGGVVDFGTATSAFEGCTSLSAVNVKGTVIPASAFKGSKVKDIKVGGAQIVPTYVGASAFENNTAVKEIDLKNAATIEASAFKGATSFVGKGKNGVVTLSVTEVAARAFEGTAVVRFQLLNARRTNSYSLASTALKQIKYRQTDLTIASDQVITPANVDIFLKNATEQVKFPGYRTVTEEDSDWEY